MTSTVAKTFFAILILFLELPLQVEAGSFDDPPQSLRMASQVDSSKDDNSTELQSGISECRRGAYEAAKTQFLNALAKKDLPIREQDEINGWLSYTTNMLGEDTSRAGVQAALQPDKLSVFLATCDSSEFFDYSYFLPKFYPDESQTRKLLGQRESLLPADHPLIAQSYRYLAHILWFTDKKQQARECLLKAVQKFERSLGDHDLAVAETYGQLIAVSFGFDSSDPVWLTYKQKCQDSLPSSSNDALSRARLLLTKARVSGGYLLPGSQDESVSLCKEALKVLEENNSSVLWKTLVFNALAQIYQTGQAYETARASLQQSVDAWTSNDGYPLDAAFGYSRLGEICSFVGDTKGGFSNHENALKYYLKVWPETSACAARLTYQLAIYSSDNREEMKLLLEEAVQKLRKACGDNSPETAAALKALAYLEAKENPDKAKEHMAIGVANERKPPSGPAEKLEDTNKLLEQSLFKLQNGEYEESDLLFRKYMSQFRQELSKLNLSSPAAGPSLSYFQRMYLEILQTGNSQQSDLKRIGPGEKDFVDVWGNWEFPLVGELLKKLEQHKQIGDVRAIVRTQLEIALLLQFQSHKIKTPFAINALELLKKECASRIDRSELGVACLMAACVLAANEESALAQEAANLAIATIQTRNSTPRAIEENIDLSNNAAVFFLRSRHLASARNACDLAIALSKQLKLESNSSELLARSYALSAKVASQQSDVSVAAEHAELARRYAKDGEPWIQKLALESSISAAQCCGTLAEAEKFARDLLGIVKRTSDGKNFPSRELMAAQTTLATVLAMEGKFEESESTLNSIDFSRTPNPFVEESFESFTATYECRAQLNLHAGKMLEARNQLLTACGWPDDATRVLQQKPYDAWLQDINTISLIDVKNGHPEIAAQTVQKSAALIDSFVCSSFDQMSFSEQCAFVAALRRQSDALLSFGTRPEVIASSYGYLMRWRAMLVQALRRQAEAECIASQSKPELVAKLQKIEDELSSMQYATKSDAEWCLRHQELCASLEQCQREIAVLNKTNLDKSGSSNKGVAQIQEALSPVQCLIDSYVYTPVGQEKPHYGVFVLLKDAIKFHDLGECAAINSKVHELLDGIRARIPVNLVRGARGVRVKTLTDGKNVDPTFLQDLISQVTPQNIDQVFLCLDGELALIPPAVLFTKDKKVAQLDNARQLIDDASSGSTVGADRVLLVGDVDFAGFLPRLPFTRTENERIGGVARELKMDVVDLTGDKATKRSVKAELPAAVVAHIATHGFFEDQGPVVANARSAFSQPMSAVQLAELGRNPLLQSGLVFASEPGVKASQRMTAEEIATVNLSNCHLITLSACETGRGRAYSGQGIVGLRSCLVSSGAKRLLISLWSVDDEATSALMGEFYNQLWKNKQPPHTALTLAQERVKSNEKWAHPFYWAGWVLLGK